MRNLQASLVKYPYGLAFSIEELLLVRSWAEHRKLRLFVALDQVIDGTEFEEMLILSPPHRVRRTLTLWRTHTGIFAQSPYSRPRAFTTLSVALEAVRPQLPRRKGWRSLLGLGD